MMMKLRAVDNKDLEILASMNFELIRDEGHRNKMNISELQKRMEKWLETKYKAAVFEENNKIIGYALWCIENEFIYIRQFYIKPDYRRLGVGSKAFHKLKSTFWANQALRLEVLIQNTRAHSFWVSVGFTDYSLTMESPGENKALKNSC